MEHSLKTLTMAAGLFLTCVLISFSLLVVREGKQLGNTFLRQLREEERLYGEYKWTRYEGSIVSGAEVINFLKRSSDKIVARIDNGSLTLVFGMGRKFMVSENIPKEPSYIDPFDEYIGNIERGKNEEVTAINFKKVRQS